MRVLKGLVGFLFLVPCCLFFKLSLEDLFARDGSFRGVAGVRVVK